MITNKEIGIIFEENKKRRDDLFSFYDPITGVGSPLKRVKVEYFYNSRKFTLFVPESMYQENKRVIDLLNQLGSPEEVVLKVMGQGRKSDVDILMANLNEQRMKHDFEFWAYTCGKIQDKISKEQIQFRLNKAQRKLLVELEDMRLNNIPIRIILLKARQWGGSTMVQYYMAWIQTQHKKNWHSAIIADVEDQARNIRGMYTTLAREYPKAVGSITFEAFEGSTKNKRIVERNCIVGVGSVQKPDNLRSFDFAMSHLSEVGLWKSTAQKSAEDLAQSIRATIPNEPYTLAVMESTAKGVGNFFHREWISAVNKISDYRPVFVAWWEIEIYQRPILDYTKFIRWVFRKGNEYAQFLWELGATLEGINWYIRTKKGEGYDDWRMNSEFPSTPEEAFQSTGRRAFAPVYVQKARQNCKEPEIIGDLDADSHFGPDALKNIRFVKNPAGELWIWSLPDKSLNIPNRYPVSVDIGGRTKDADWSVIRVIDRYWMIEGGKPEVVATWRGHLDQDLVAWKAAQIGWFYNKGIVAIEVNSLRTETEGTEGEHSLTILDEIKDYYPNLYARTDPERVREGIPAKYGFHTNLSTKPMVINLMNAVLREEGYIERDSRACDEMDMYEIKQNGTLGAVDGGHDDIVITTAIDLWIVLRYLPPPKIVTKTSTSASVKKVQSEASF